MDQSPQKPDLEHLSRHLLGRAIHQLQAQEHRVLHALAKRTHLARNIDHDFQESMTFGQRVADRVARCGGSWTFILIFLALLIGWVSLNSFLLARRQDAFDPYPYILLNLFLSMIAALQAPVILMSQNRQAARDRLDAGHDYEINLKAELEVRTLQEALDELHRERWPELLALQRQQVALLEELLLLARAGPAGGVTS